jgi:hypothetical protein
MTCRSAKVLLARLTRLGSATTRDAFPSTSKAPPGNSAVPAVLAWIHSDPLMKATGGTRFWPTSPKTSSALPLSVPKLPDITVEPLKVAVQPLCTDTAPPEKAVLPTNVTYIV